MTKKFSAYQGTRLILEWYFNEKGKSEALECYYSLSPDRKSKILFLFRLLGDIGSILNKEKFWYEGDGIYALKASKDEYYE